MQWDAVFAAAVTVLAQAALLWLLARAMQPPPVTRSTEGTAIQVTWLPRAVPRTSPVATAPTNTRPAAATVAPSTRRPPPPPDAAVDADPTAESPRPMAAVYLLQARQNAQASDTTTASDPLADRRVRLPGEGGQRFRMRPPPGGGAAVVSKAGRLFGAEDAGAPCRETSRNINDLALDGDSAQLQQQIDRERRLCRP